MKSFKNLPLAKRTVLEVVVTAIIVGAVMWTVFHDEVSVIWLILLCIGSAAGSTAGVLFATRFARRSQQ